MSHRGRLARTVAEAPFQRLVLVALLLAAALPVVVLGVLVYSEVERGLAADALERTNRALDTTDAVIQQAEMDLGTLTRSYATWPTFRQMTAASDLEAIRTDVLAFLVERGTVTAGIAQAPGGATSAGEPTLTAQLARRLEQAGPLTRVITVGEAVYLVAVEPVGSGDAGGAPVGRILLARRLDARFTANLRRLTGFEVALLAANGGSVVSTDPTTTALPDPGVLLDRSVVHDGDRVVTRLFIGSPASDAAVVLATRISALQATAGGLPVLVLSLLVATILLAALLAVALARALGGRLRVIHDGLTAIADGRVPPASPAHGADEIARLGAGLGRLVETLDQREATLRRCLAAAATVPVQASPAEAARRLSASAMEIFGMTWCRIVDADGGLLAEAGSPPAVGTHPLKDDGRLACVTHAPMDLAPDGLRLEAGVEPGAPWTDGDQAGLEVMALLAGTVVRDAEHHTRVAGRADRLDRLNRLQREVLRGISHNLRAPLATIEMAASDLVEVATDDYSAERAVLVQAEGRRLARLVNQVLILSRIESGTLELDWAPLALAPILRRLAAEMRIRERVELVDHTGGAVAFGDPGASEQIAWILLDNAARYAPEGRILVELTLTTRPPGGGEPKIILAVEDEGPGVAPAERRHIFGRFVRGSSTVGVEGAGLGLSIARGLARAMGGDVRYRAGAVGARFEVRLPSAGSQHEPASANAEDPVTEGTAIPAPPRSPVRRAGFSDRDRKAPIV